MSRQQLLLTEMRARADLGVAYSVFDEKALAVQELKAAVSLEAGAYPPLFSDVVNDAEWKEQVNQIYLNAWSSLIGAASDEDVRGTVLTPRAYLHVLPSNRSSLSVVFPTETPHGRDHFVAINRLNMLSKSMSVSAEERMVLESAITILDAWIEREGSARRKRAIQGVRTNTVRHAFCAGPTIDY